MLERQALLGACHAVVPNGVPPDRIPWQCLPPAPHSFVSGMLPHSPARLALAQGLESYQAPPADAAPSASQLTTYVQASCPQQGAPQLAGRPARRLPGPHDTARTSPSLPSPALPWEQDALKELQRQRSLGCTVTPIGSVSGGAIACCRPAPLGVQRWCSACYCWNCCQTTPSLTCCSPS